MKPIHHWTLIARQQNRIDLECDHRHSLQLFVLEDDVIRVLFKKNKTLRLDRTWSIAPDGNDVNWQGRDRMSTDGFSLPSFTLEHTDSSIVICTQTLRLTVSQPLKLSWEYKHDGQWQALMSDRATRPYQFGVKSNAISHYLTHDHNDLYYGLGERAGNLKRNGNRYEMRNLDAMGYDAEKTDPLYKHIPFYITRKSSGVSLGIFYDNLATSWFDLGNELDNYHGPYRSYRAEDGDLDYYVMLGPKVLDVTKRFTRLCGRTAFGPKWSLGYSGSTMHYTDADNAQEQLKQFTQLCQQHDIPCDSFQLSSGYTSIGNKRYVFNWNTNKVPKPEEMVEDFHRAGMKLAANIKPCLLNDHPHYQEAAELGLFIQDSEHDHAEQSTFWDDNGSHLDFTNPKTVQWWQDNVTEQLLEKGIDATWNDNNEFEVWDSYARCNGFGSIIDAGLIRPLQALLMMRSSYEAQQKFAPELRPFLISRSGCAGMHRYVQTWSGDNRTDWKTLRYNIRMGLGLSLSGVSNVGHDIGGFAGDQPDPELFIRWVQNGAMHPRFTIHSWNDDGTVNEPWMFPEATPMVRSAIKLRYRLLPYLYNLLWRAHRYDEPMLRPTFLDHEHDVNTFEECDDYLLGSEILVASVVEQGQRTRQVYLPDNDVGWYDFNRHTWHAGGQHLVVPAPLNEIPLLIKAGSILPTSSRKKHVDVELDNERQLLVFPLQQSGATITEIFDDDGSSHAYLDDGFFKLLVEMICDDDCIYLNLSRDGNWQPTYDELSLVLPKGENRSLIVNDVEASSNFRLLLNNIKGTE